jgi:hypothetical protein
LQLAEFGSVQTPFWQTAGGMQGGPFVSLQFWPSAAAARQVPPAVHLPLEPQRVTPPSATPQAAPPPATLAAVHLSVAAAQ